MMPIVALVLSAFIPTARCFARDMKGLKRWVGESDIRLHPAVEWQQNQNDDWTLKLSKRLPAGSVVLSVPNLFILRSDQENSRHKQEFSQLKELGLKDHARELDLFLQLLDMQKNGEESPLEPWIRSLPQNFSCAVDLCVETEIPHLPVFTQALVWQQRQRFQVFKQVAGKLNHWDEELMKWAFNVVYSRSWRRSGSSCVDIVPIGDMFNHNDPATVVVEYTPNEVHFVTKTPSVDQLSLSYGEATNPHRFLAVFGFALDESTMPYMWTQLLLDGSDESNDHNRGRFLAFNTQTGEMDESVYMTLVGRMLQSQNRTYDSIGDMNKFRRPVDAILLEHLTNLQAECERGSIAETSDLVRRFNAFLSRSYAKALKGIS